MEPIPFETGRVVTSTQGRDRKRSFVVLAPPEDDYVMMADGCTRKLEHPKKKKMKHLRPRPVRMDALETLRAQRRLKDSDIRSFLKDNGFGPEEPLCKED